MQKRMAIMGTASAAVLIAGGALATPNLKITEIMSKSAVTEDWFEITNFGDTAADITGWSYDDESADPLEKRDILNVTSIAAGESVVVLQIGNDSGLSAEVQAFRDFWGGIDNIQIGVLVNDPAGLGKNDGLVIFDADENIVLQQFYNGDPKVHAGEWAGGQEWDSANFIGNNTWVAGSGFDGQFGIRASAETFDITDNDDIVIDTFNEYGSPGSAVPEPTSLALLSIGALTMIKRRRRN